MPDSSSSPPASAHLDADTLTGLVLGLAGEEAVAEAIAHAGTCTRCETRLRDAVGDLESFRARCAVMREFGGVPADDRARRSTSPPRRLIVLQWGIPLAAAAAVVVVLTRLPGGVAPQETSPYWIPATTDVRVLRDARGDDADSSFWAGLEAYESHDPDRARALLEGAHATGGMEELRRLYLASSLLNTARVEESLRLLQTLPSYALPMPWRQDARWMTYQALERLHRGAEADSLLGVMAAWPGHVGDLARAARAARAGHRAR